MTWEFDFLYALQGIHNPILDQIMVVITTLGNAGLIWIGLSIVLVCIPKTRKCGLTMMIGMMMTFVFGNLILKNIIARPRPFAIDESIELLVKKPSEYSFPSGHTMNGFTASVVILIYYFKQGIPAILLASLIAFSRMYIFVHYPTDIIGGIVIGVCDAILAYYIVKKLGERKIKKEGS